MAKDDRNLPARTDDEDRVSLATWMFGLDKPGLTDRPQKWGIVPTVRFWNRLDTLKHQLAPVGLGLTLAMPLMAVLITTLAPVIGLWPAALLAMPFGVAMGLLPLGLFERWLRKEIERRRGALPPADE